MKKFLFITLLGCLLCVNVHAQNHVTQKENVPAFMQRVTKEISEFKIDTTTVPNDKITRKIEELRKYRGNFNVNTLVDFMLQQEKNSHKIPEASYNKAYNFFKNGDGARWLHNAVIWIYRKHFTYKELKAMTRFYKSSAGQKWASEFPIVAIQNFLAAQQIGKVYKKQH